MPQRSSKEKAIQAACVQKKVDSGTGRGVQMGEGRVGEQVLCWSHPEGHSEAQSASSCSPCAGRDTRAGLSVGTRACATRRQALGSEARLPHTGKAGVPDCRGAGSGVTVCLCGEAGGQEGGSVECQCVSGCVGAAVWGRRAAARTRTCACVPASRVAWRGRKESLSPSLVLHPPP